MHIHGRDLGDFTNCTDDPEVYREILGRVREKCPEMIINITTGGGPTTTDDGRIAILDAGPEMATLNLGPDMERFELAARKPPLPHPREAMVVDMCMPFTYGFIDRLATVMLEKGIKPELGDLPARAVLGEPRACRARADQAAVLAPVRHGRPDRHVPDALERAGHVAGAAARFAVHGAGIGKFQWPLVTMGMILGGNVRVGLEDNLYESRGRKLEGNGEAVEKVVRLAEEFGREIATPAQAREMLGLSATPSSY